MCNKLVDHFMDCVFYFYVYCCFRCGNILDDEPEPRIIRIWSGAECQQTSEIVLRSS